MATGKPIPVDTAMTDAISRTSAWVNRAGVVLDPTPLYGNSSQLGMVQKDQTMLRRENPIPSELANAILQMDAVADQAEHHQAKEQARLLQRFQQLKLWQQQQQERLLQQQQEQLQLLRLEQQRVEQTLVAQRQKQWGGIQEIKQSPPRGRTAPHDQRSPAASPLRSSLPEALAKASISLGMTAGPLVLNPLLMDAQKDMTEGTNSRVELDSASEVDSSLAEEGVYPLPETASEMSFGIIGESKEEGPVEEGRNMDDDQQRVGDEEANTTLESLHDAAALSLKDKEMTDSPQDAEEPWGDDRPIRSALCSKAKTFEELLEEKLKTEPDKYQPPSNPSQISSTESPRCSFLRKGAGTARYGVISKKPPKPPSPRTTKAAAASHAPKTAPSKKASGGVPDNSLKSSSAGSQKVTPVTINKLSLVKREDKTMKGEKNKRGKKDEGPQMARKVASKPVVASKPSQEPLSKQILTSQPKPVGYSAGLDTFRHGDTRPKKPEESADHHDQDLPREGGLPDDTIEMSFQMRMKEWELNEKVEQDELDEFELLEEAADDNASFTSNASVVVNMMQRATLQKQKLMAANSLEVTSKPREKNLRLGQNAIQGPGLQSKSSNKSPDSSHNVIRAGSSHQGDASGDLTAGDRTLTGDDEELKEGKRGGHAGSLTEEDSDDMSEGNEDGVLEGEKRHSHQGKVVDRHESRARQISTAGDQSDLYQEDDTEDDDRSTDSEEDLEKNSDLEEEKPSRSMKRKAATSSHAADVNFDDDESWGDFGDAGLESFDEDEDEEDEDDDASVILAGAPSATSTPPPAVTKKGRTSVLDRRKEFPTESTHPSATASPPTSSLVSKLFPKLKPTQKASQPKQDKSQKVPPSAQVPEPSSLAESLQSKLLKEKLVELEAEIAKFRRENAALAKLRDEREKGLSDLDKQVAEFQKLKAEELKNLQEYKEAEMKKIRKEKRTFEKYQKAARALPDKKDREEIELLKQQLTELQDEMTRRETRWTAASTRLRDRTDILEKENAELREEMKLLEQQRLQAWKREEDKAKSNQPKPKQHVPVINKQKLPPLLSLSDHEMRQDLRDASEPKKEPGQEKAKVVSSPNTAPDHPHPQGTNSKLMDKQEPMPSSDDDTLSSSKPPRISQRKRSVRFDVDNTPQKHPIRTMGPDVSLDLFSPTRDDGHYTATSANSPVVDTRGPQTEEGNRSLNNNNDEKEEIHHPDGKVEEIRNDGSRVITYGNQTRKEISADGQSVTVTFFNGDIKRILPDQRVMYYYAETRTTHTTYPDGLEIIQFSNNQTEKHYPNGTKEITFADQTIKYLFPNGNEESIFPDGTVLRAERNGDRTMEFPNGQREVHTAQYKRREYPDGTIKTVYPDGRQETRYSSGRIRVKDKEGRVILDKK